MHCRTVLGRREITQQKLDMLQEALVDFVIEKEDIYQNTNPQEFDKFLKLLNTEKKLSPFDIVIDGLNVTYAVSPQHLQHLHDTVKHFSDKGCKVMVIHRD